MEQPKEFTLKMLKDAIKKIDFLEVKSLGNGLYQFAEGIIGDERFLQEVDNAIRTEVSHIDIDWENMKKILPNGVNITFNNKEDE